MDVGSFNVEVSAVVDVPSAWQNSSWLDSTVRGGHDLDYATGCSETGHLSLPFRSLACNVQGAWLSPTGLSEISSAPLLSSH